MKPKLPKFPTMLRKMWSGTEVQQWLDENVLPLFEQTAEPLTAAESHGCHGGDGATLPAAIEADRQTNKALLHYMPETIAALKATGCNESLVTDIEKAMHGEYARQARGEPVGYIAAGLLSLYLENCRKHDVDLHIENLPVASRPPNGCAAGAVPIFLSPQPQQIHEGYKLVPIEPTDAMLGAGLRYIDGMAAMPSAYKAMLEAAPQPTNDHLSEVDHVKNDALAALDDIRGLMARHHKTCHDEFFTELCGIVTAAPQPPQIPEGYRLQPLSEFDAMMNTRTIPEGYKIVPIEPTWEMLFAGDVEFGKRKIPSISGICYKAMLEAAPEVKP